MMNDLGKRIVGLYQAETGVTLRVTMTYELGTKAPWTATIGVYNARPGNGTTRNLGVAIGPLRGILASQATHVGGVNIDH